MSQTDLIYFLQRVPGLFWDTSYDKSLPRAETKKQDSTTSWKPRVWFNIKDSGDPVNQVQHGTETLMDTQSVF